MRNENQMVPKAVRSLPIASSIIARLTFDDVDQVPDVQSWEQPEALEPNGQVYRAGMRLKLHAFAVSTLLTYKVSSPIFFFGLIAINLSPHSITLRLKIPHNLLPIPPNPLPYLSPLHHPPPPFLFRVRQLMMMMMMLMMMTMMIPPRRRGE